jgi:hypothetical protein
MQQRRLTARASEVAQRRSLYRTVTPTGDRVPFRRASFFLCVSRLAADSEKRRSFRENYRESTQPRDTHYLSGVARRAVGPGRPSSSLEEDDALGHAHVLGEDGVAVDGDAIEGTVHRRQHLAARTEHDNAVVAGVSDDELA